MRLEGRLVDIAKRHLVGRHGRCVEHAVYHDRAAHRILARHGCVRSRAPGLSLVFRFCRNRIGFERAVLEGHGRIVVGVHHDNRSTEAAAAFTHRNTDIAGDIHRRGGIAGFDPGLLDIDIEVFRFARRGLIKLGNDHGARGGIMRMIALDGRRNTRADGDAHHAGFGTLIVAACPAAGLSHRDSLRLGLERIVDVVDNHGCTAGIIFSAHACGHGNGGLHHALAREEIRDLLAVFLRLILFGLQNDVLVEFAVVEFGIRGRIPVSFGHGIERLLLVARGIACDDLHAALVGE